MKPTDNILQDTRFNGLTPFADKQWLASPSMHGEELTYIEEAFRTNWMSTVGANIDSVEENVAKLIGVPYVVGLSCGTAALHLSIRLAGELLYGRKPVQTGTLDGKKVFCSDMTFDASVNPVAYEGGEAVFIDSERDTWNTDPAALEEAFKRYPDTKLVVMAHLYGTPGKIKEIRRICDAHGALLIEDAAESMGASVDGQMTGSFGDFGIVSFNGNKIITGSCGGALLCRDKAHADRIRKWSTQSREPALWYQHEDLGYNYRMSNVVAGVIRGQFLHLDEHIAQKKAVYERYREGLKDLPMDLNPLGDGIPNYWLSCITIHPEAMCETHRTGTDTEWTPTHGHTCPDEIFTVLRALNAESRPIWKPMHMQPLYKDHVLVSAEASPVSEDIFARGLCLPSDNKMTPENQERIMEIIRRVFG